MKDLVIVGAGGLGRETAWVIERINQVKKTWNLLGFIDASQEKGTLLNGWPVLGGDEWLENRKEPVCLTVAIGNPGIKKNFVHKHPPELFSYATLIDPSVIMPEQTPIGAGSIIFPNVVITANVNIGDLVYINANVTISHDVKIGSFTSVYAGVQLAGAVTVGSEVEIGTGARVIPGKTIGDQAVIGAGAVVIEDIPAQVTAVGNPARVLE